MKLRTGPWNGIRFSGMPDLNPNHANIYDTFLFDRDEIYYSYKLHNSSILSRLVLTQDGSVRSYNWINRSQVWEVLLGTAADTCDNYGILTTPRYVVAWQDLDQIFNKTGPLGVQHMLV